MPCLHRPSSSWCNGSWQLFLGIPLWAFSLEQSLPPSAKLWTGISKGEASSRRKIKSLALTRPSFSFESVATFNFKFHDLFLSHCCAMSNWKKILRLLPPTFATYRLINADFVLLFLYIYILYLHLPYSNIASFVLYFSLIICWFKKNWPQNHRNLDSHLLSRVQKKKKNWCITLNTSIHIPLAKSFLDWGLSGGMNVALTGITEIYA